MGRSFPRFGSCAAIAAAVALLGVGAPAADAAVPATAPVTQHATGSAGGLSATDAHGFMIVTGTYTLGQLGTGDYLVERNHQKGGFDARLRRSDGRVFTGHSSSFFSFDLKGSGDIVSAHITARVLKHDPLGGIGRFPGSLSLALDARVTMTRRIGYALLDGSGRVHTLGGIDEYGDAPTTLATDVERTGSGRGYWVVNSKGQVYAFGDARWFGNASGLAAGERVISISRRPDNTGYWLFTSRGRALAFGSARFFGDMRRVRLNGPVVGSIATPSGKGYYMVASDGGIFTFGDAQFHGSMGNQRLNKPIIGLVPTPDSKGYWLVASDGGVFTFNAPFRGSLGNKKLNRPVVTLAPYGNGYLMVAADGGTFNFSNNPNLGSLADRPLPAPITNAAAIG